MFCSIYGMAITDAFLAHSYFQPQDAHKNVKLFAATLMEKFLKIEIVDEPIIDIPVHHRSDSVLKLSNRLQLDQKPKKRFVGMV